MPSRNPEIPVEATAPCPRHGGPIRLLLTHVVLPQTDRHTSFRHSSLERPEAAFLYVSCYTEDAIEYRGVLNYTVKFLEKPFTVYQVTSEVCDALNRPVLSWAVSDTLMATSGFRQSLTRKPFISLTLLRLSLYDT